MGPSLARCFISFCPSTLLLVNSVVYPLRPYRCPCLLYQTPLPPLSPDLLRSAHSVLEPVQPGPRSMAPTSAASTAQAQAQAGHQAPPSGSSAPGSKDSAGVESTQAAALHFNARLPGPLQYVAAAAVPSPFSPSLSSRARADQGKKNPPVTITRASAPSPPMSNSTAVGPDPPTTPS